MEREFTFGRMEESTKENIIMIKKKDTEYINGRMGESILVNGKTGNNMEKENINFQMELKELDSGKKEKDLDGRMRLLARFDVT
jgi:hypothetical protein